MKRVFLLVSSVLLVFLLAACASGMPEAIMEEAPAEEPAVEEPAAEEAPAEERVVEGETVIETVEVVKEVEVVVTATPSIAEEPAEEPVEQEPIATLLLPSPTLQPQPTQLPAQEPVTEARMVEFEWPARMHLGDSDTIRLALVPTEGGYEVTVEFDEHAVQTQDVVVERPPGYDLYAVARLDGVGFSIAPGLEQVDAVIAGERVDWRWTLAPREPGQQRLSVSLRLRWTPQPGVEGQVREVPIYSRGVNVQVISFMGLNRRQTMLAGLVGLFFGGGLSLTALVYRPRPVPLATRILKPKTSLVIEPHPDLALPPIQRNLLKVIFSRYSRLVIEREFLSGYSGARTFLALPVRPDGRVDAYTIVKISERESIEQEYQNYQAYVKDTLPPMTARIQHPPVTVSDTHLSAVQYTFIGEPGTMPASLRQALLEDSDPGLLEKLFNTFGPNWWMQRRANTFRLAQEYDRKLPTHYVVEPAVGGGKELDGRKPPTAYDYQVGDLVTLRGFSKRELRVDGKSYSLESAPAPGHPPLRVRWLSTETSEGGTGRVVDTRWEMLANTVKGFELHGLPDPLVHLPELLTEIVSGTQAVIHGDLNLENVLVGPGDFVWLIDFALTRDGHPLYDFAHLHAEIIAHVLAGQVASSEGYLALLQEGGNPLLNAITGIAHRCLFNPSVPREYDLALYMACVGALKFANLTPFAKHLLYLTAAHTVQRL